LGEEIFLMNKNREKLVIALDVSSWDDAKSLVRDLASCVGVFKVGQQLFTRIGPDVVRFIHDQGAQVFLDLKFHDIPNTVYEACLVACELGVKMFNVHASGGLEMMKAAARARMAARPKVNSNQILGVTVLTSLNENTLHAELRISGSVSDYVLHLAKLAQKSGLNGVVASPHEIATIRDICGVNFTILTPGVRPTWAEVGDQKRVMTPKEAIQAGADYIVVGRPITGAKDKVGATKKILEEISG
jgi:orotidine-5'-phosphate decarboxylase